MFGRVAIAQTMRDVSPDLMDILGAASALPVGTDGAADEGGAEYVFRLARPDGDLRRHPGGVPQHDRPACARAGQAELLAGPLGLDPHGVPKLCEELVVVVAADDVVRHRDPDRSGGLDRAVGSRQHLLQP